MKKHFQLQIYILTDSNGEWWETFNTFGNTRRFKPGTSIYETPKRFKTVESATKQGVAYGRSFRILELTEPPKGKREWGQTIVFESETNQTI
jgi:hypothetical protein